MLSVRCSSLDQLFTCHAARLLQEKVNAVSNTGLSDDDEGHAVQWAGSWCHHHGARRLRDEFGAVGNPDPLTIPASFVPSGYDEWVVDWYVCSVTKLIPTNYALFIERELKRVFPLRRPVVFRNYRTGLLETHTHIELTGHLDVSAVSPDLKTGVIIDLKRGYEVVGPAEFNWQLAGYGVLFKAAVPTLEQVLLQIKQPAAPERTTEAVVKNLPDLEALIEAELNKMVEDAYTFSTGKPCKYCDALLVCPTARKDIKTMRETLTPELFESIKTVASTEDLGDLAFHAKKLEYPITRIVKAFKERLEQAGGEVILKDGTKAAIIEEEGNRKIDDVQFAHSRLASKVGANAAWGTLKMSLGEAEDALAAAGMQRSSKKKDVETAKGWIDLELGGVISRPKQKTLIFS